MSLEFLPHADKFDFRRFDARVEARALQWSRMAVDRSDWRPYAPQGQPAPNLETTEWVTDGHTLAFVKRRARLEEKQKDSHLLGSEKIAADMAYDLGVPVAPGCLWQPPSRPKAKPWYLSLAPFAFGARNEFSRFASRAPGLAGLTDACDRRLARARFERQILTEAAAANTTLWVFHVWIGDQAEHKRANNLQASLTNRRHHGSRLAAHDHAYARMGFIRPEISSDQYQDSLLWPFAGKNAVFTDRLTGGDHPGVTGSWRPPIDVAAADAILKRLEAYPRKRIAEIVYRIPPALFDGRSKERILADLVDSQRRTIGWFNRRLEDYQNGYNPLARPTVARHVGMAP